MRGSRANEDPHLHPSASSVGQPGDLGAATAKHRRALVVVGVRRRYARGQHVVTRAHGGPHDGLGVAVETAHPDRTILNRAQRDMISPIFGRDGVGANAHP